jgi:hypothetical protein
MEELKVIRHNGDDWRGSGFSLVAFRQKRDEPRLRFLSCQKEKSSRRSVSTGGAILQQLVDLLKNYLLDRSVLPFRETSSFTKQ